MFRVPSLRSTVKAGCLALAPVVVFTLAAPLASSANAATAVESSGRSAALAFELPPVEVLRSSPRKVFAHMMPSLPVSIDNQPPASDYWARNYLTPGGEKGKHAAYGGYARDRPATRDPRPEASWKLLDMEGEVRDGIAAGLDGFSIDLLQLGDTGGALWDRTNLLLQAAHNVDPGFKILLMPDMTGSLHSKDVATVAKYVAQLGSAPAAYRLSDGRLVVSPFTAERHSVQWWTEFLTIMRTTYNTPVAFVPLFQDERTWAASFAPISYGMSNWGNRNPAGNDPTATHAGALKARIAAVHALGQKWMQPVSVQDERPRSGIYDEAENTTNLRNTWRIAIDNAAEFVQLTTWNDYAEGSQMAPSVKHGWSYLDINAYYLTAYKTGRPPAIVRDTVYLTHRTQPVAATPSYPQTKLMNLRRGSSPARDTVEALTFLTAPAAVTLTVGARTHTCEQPAGVATCTVPLSPGTVSAALTRGGTTLGQVTSPHTVTTTPYVQDLQYVASSSRREGTSTDASATVPVPRKQADRAHLEEVAPVDARVSRDSRRLEILSHLMTMRRRR